MLFWFQKNFNLTIFVGKKGKKNANSRKNANNKKLAKNLGSKIWKNKLLLP
jgi:hypothetical protein